MSTLQPEMQQIWHLMNITKPKFSPGVQAHLAVPPPILFPKSAPACLVVRSVVTGCHCLHTSVFRKVAFEMQCAMFTRDNYHLIRVSQSCGRSRDCKRMAHSIRQY